MPDRPRVRGVYAIADTHILSATRLLEAVAQAIAGGAALIQYRDKTHDPVRRAREARALQALCRTHGVPLLINDDVALAAEIGAAGVHLGREDAPIDAARRALGPTRLIGVSCYNELARALAAQAQGADYVAFGSFFPSPTKPQAVRAELALLRNARAQLHVPLVAIGGITPDNGAALLTAGADALAVITGIFQAPDVRAATARYAALFSG
jgi:thiamine-phosphate pyrophosphorylase